MQIYLNVIFPLFHDWAVGQRHWHQYRRAVLSRVQGEVLEIGAGSGLNLRHYPPHVRRLVTVEPNPGMNRRLERRARESGIAVQRCVASAESLPFDDESFDCVVSTLTLCSIPAVMAAAKEVYRVLRPGGQFLFLEHGLSPDCRVRKWQLRLNGAWRWLGAGCHLDVDVRKVVSDLPFHSIDIQNFYMEEVPKTHGYMYQGVAIR